MFKPALKLIPALIPSLILGATLALGATVTATAADLIVAIDGVQSADGQIMIALYNSVETFRATPFRAEASPAKAGAMTVLLKDLPPGDYAIALFHDANGNGKMDSNGVGMPVEDYGFSNNAVGKRGAPSFEAARFTLPAAGAATSISLR